VLRRLAAPGRGERHEEVVRKLSHRIQTLRVGDPLDKNTDIGAINSKAQLEKIHELVDSGSRRGRP
jgi:aldehyde dehydrogenase (NAD+)